jgi:hypothetical protein
MENLGRCWFAGCLVFSSNASLILIRLKNTVGNNWGVFLTYSIQAVELRTQNEIRAGHLTNLLRALISIIFDDGQNVTFLVKLNQFQILEVVLKKYI